MSKIYPGDIIRLWAWTVAGVVLTVKMTSKVERRRECTITTPMYDMTILVGGKVSSHRVNSLEAENCIVVVFKHE